MMERVHIPFTTEVIAQNIVTFVREEENGDLIIGIRAERPAVWTPEGCERAYRFEVYTTDYIEVQELGLPNQNVIYEVEVKRCRLTDSDGKMHYFTLPINGLSLRVKMSQAVMEKALYFIIDRNQSLAETVILLKDLYGVNTSTSALDRLKEGEADKLPTLGEIIRLLNEQKPITQLHIDEFKAKGKRGWNLIVRDEHGRLLFVLPLEKRSEWVLRVHLRWLRMLGLKIRVCYVDGWAGYIPAIVKVFPLAKIQYDYFHIIQNIWRHLYKAFTAYRKEFKKAKTEKEKEKLRDQMHKELWQNRFLFFTREENLSEEEKERLKKLLDEHEESILLQIVEFTRRIWDMFEKSPKKITAHLKRLDLIAEGWADINQHFARAMKFLSKYFKQMITYIDDDEVQRNSLAETTVRMVRRIEGVRQGFKKAKGRIAHFKLWIYRRYLRATS